MPDEQVRIVRHSNSRLHGWTSSRLGHSLSVVSTLRGNDIEEVLEVQDETTGDEIQLATPGQTAHAKALKSAFHTSWITFLVITGRASAPGVALLTGLLAGLIIYLLLGARMAPRQKLAPADQKRLAEWQSLLAKKSTLGAAQDASSADLGRNIELRRRLKLLAAEMARLDQELYATRIERLNDANRLLWEQAEIDRRLIEGYRKAIAMIEIEIKSYGVADSISEDSTGRIEAKIAELDALREAIQDRERELAANEELERFLEAPGNPEL